MTTGIYKITFPDGSYYIGKSINVEERWKQHLDKMQKGTAAKPMQAKWNKFGNFDAGLIVECHEDHIDILEETFIARLKPELNTTRPKDRMPGIYDEDFDKVLSYLDMSTLSHIHTMIALLDISKERAAKIEELEEKVEDLSIKRNQEELEADVQNRISELNEIVRELDEQMTRKDEDIVALQKELKYRDDRIKDLMKPWWKRIFS